MASAAIPICGVVEECLACTEKDDAPAADGVPEITPLAAFSVKPAGNDPDATVQVYGAVPPLTESVPVYAFCTEACGSPEPLICRGDPA